jgi:hypothetical protein
LTTIGIAIIIFSSSQFVLWQLKGSVSMKKFASLSDLNASGPESTLNNQPILHPSSGNDILDINTVSRRFFSL